jgi:hypothetical protein
MFRLGIAGFLIGSALGLSGLIPASFGVYSAGIALLAGCLLAWPFASASRRIAERLPNEQRTAIGIYKAAANEPLRKKAAVVLANLILAMCVFLAGFGFAFLLILAAQKQLS